MRRATWPRRTTGRHSSTRSGACRPRPRPSCCGRSRRGCTAPWGPAPTGNFRLVSATNADVDALVAAGQFREDLAERLAGVVVHVPPLAARRSDLPALVRHFTARVEGADARPFTDAALDRLAAYDWPRNVRELRHVVERALVWGAGPVVDVDSVRQALSRGATLKVPPAAISGWATGAHDRTADDTTVDGGRQQLIEVLRACEGNTELAARTLGVARATLYRRLERFGLRARDVVPRLSAS